MAALTYRLRVAAPKDADALCAVYAPFVEQTAISFEYDVPDTAEFARRVESTLQRYPYLLAEDAHGTVLGYACTHTFLPRAAYDRCAETTIYLSSPAQRGGLGCAFYGALEELSRAQGICNLYACIGEPEGAADEYLGYNSIRFHEYMGYRRIGVFTRCGYKFGRWYNMVWAEKLLSSHAAQPQPFVPFPQLDGALVADILRKYSTF